MSTIVITDTNLGDGSIEKNALSSHRVRILDSSDADSIAAEAADADALLVQWAPIDAHLLDRLPRLSVIVRYGIGLDNIDLEAARERGIAVSNVADYCIEEVAAHATAFILSRARRLSDYAASPTAGQWRVADVAPPFTPSDDPVGIAGVGRIGRTLAKNMSGLGHPVVGWDPYAPEWPVGVERVDTLEELAERSNHLSLHLPLTEGTRGIASAAIFDRLGPEGHLVNTSRGGLVDEQDLLDALGADRLGFASLDVLCSEPPTGLSSQLVASPRTIVTPHAAYCSDSATLRLQRRAAEIANEMLSRVE
jgi:D-3-phosphoglycerate dehydrogenase / 2-oxoglutarate reductase